MLCSHCGHWNGEAEHRCTRCGLSLEFKPRGSVSRQGAERIDALPEPPPPEPPPVPEWKQELSRKLEGYREKRKEVDSRTAVATAPERPIGRLRADLPVRPSAPVDDQRHHVLLPDPPGTRKQKASPARTNPPPRRVEEPLRARAAAASPEIRSFSEKEIAKEETVLPTRKEALAESPRAEARPRAEASPRETPAATDWALKKPVAPIQIRAMAALMDFAVILMALGAFTAMVHLRGVAIWSPEDGIRSLVFAFFGILTFYWFFYLRYFGRTAGMTWVGLCVVNFDGELPNEAQRRTRAFGTILSAASLGLGFAWSIADDEKLTWHDRMSKTFVAHESDVKDLNLSEAHR